MTLIIHDYHRFDYIFLKKYSTIYAHKSTFSDLNLPDNIEKIIIPDDFLEEGSVRTAEYRSSIISDHIFNKIVNKKDLSGLTTFGGEIFAKFLLNKPLMHTIANLQFSMLFAEKVVKHYKIEGKVNLITKIISYDVYKALDTTFLNRNIIIPNYVLLRMKLRYLLKNTLFLCRLVLYPEYIYFKMHGKELPRKKEKYKVCGTLYDENLFDHSIVNNDFFVDNKEFTQNNVMFVVDTPQPQEYLEKIKKSKYRIIDFFSELIPSFPKKRYLYSVYRDNFLLRFYYLKLILKYPFASQTLFSTFRSIILWGLFKECFDISYFYRFMIAGDMGSLISQKKSGAKTIFVYSAVSEQFVSERTNLKQTECLDYTHMLFDTVVSCTLSNKWLSSLQNNCSEYKNIGNIFSDIIFETRKNRRNEVRKIIKIEDKKPLITFLDTSIRRHGMGIMSIKEYKSFIQSIIDLLEQYPNYYFSLSSKHLGCNFTKNDDFGISDLYEKIANHSRGRIVNNFSISSYEIMGASDLIVSASETSVLYEAISGGIKTIMYDPLGLHVHYYRKVEGWPNIAAHSFNDLKKLIDYWLLDKNGKKFSSFQECYFKKDVDQYCDGKAIERFRQILA